MKDPTCTLDESTNVLTCSGNGLLKQQDSNAFINATKIVIQEGISILNTSCFDGFYNVTEIILPESLKIINDQAISDTKIKYLYIPKGVYSMSRFIPFDQNELLEEINISSDNQNFTSFEGAVYNKDMTQLYFVPPNLNKEIFTIPYTVKSVNPSGYAFNRQKHIKHIMFLPGIKFTNDEIPQNFIFPLKIEKITFFQYKIYEIKYKETSLNITIDYNLLKSPMTCQMEMPHCNIHVFQIMLFAAKH